MVLETTAWPTNTTSCGFTNNSGYNSYYNIQPGQSLTSAGYDQTNLLQVCQAICNTSGGTAGSANSAVTNPGYPGFATANKPVTIQTIAFGSFSRSTPVPRPTPSACSKPSRRSAGTTFPSTSTDPTNGYKWCIGNLSTRTSLLQQAFSNVLNDGNSVSLVQ